VLLELSCDQGYVRLQVFDTGEGISAKFLPRVFERFRQGNGSLGRLHGGLGLGLAITQQLVELHGGTITAGSGGPGRGSTNIGRYSGVVTSRNTREAGSL
jgi:signal transduction histidine kinase